LADLYDSEARRAELEQKWQTRIDRATEFAYRQSPQNARFKGVRIRGRELVGVCWRGILRAIRPLWIRYDDREGVRIADLIRYLDRDAIVLSNGLAADIPELYSRIEGTDQEILQLLDERPSQAWVAKPTVTLDFATAKTGLEKASWRLDKLETAAGTIIAFANQRLIERRFSGLKWSVRVGGILVAVGVGLFALAPKKAEPKALDVDEPTTVSIVVHKPKAFGPDCAAERLSGVAVGGSWSRPIVVTEPTASCPGRRLTLDKSTGLAVPQTKSSASGP
jgi:hypothetical protein